MVSKYSLISAPFLPADSRGPFDRARAVVPILDREVDQGYSDRATGSITVKLPRKPSFDGMGPFQRLQPPDLLREPQFALQTGANLIARNASSGSRRCENADTETKCTTIESGRQCGRIIVAAKANFMIQYFVSVSKK